MDVLRRHPIASALAVLVGLSLLLLGRLAMRPDGPVPEATPRPMTAPARKIEPSAPPVAAAPGVVAQSTPALSTAGGTIQGRVIDAATRKPVKQFELKLKRSDSKQYGSRSWETRAFTTQDGEFAWERVAAANWVLGAVAKGYQPFVVSGLDIRDGEPTRLLVLPLQAGYSVRGRVFDKTTGVGLSEARVSYHSPGFASYMSGGDESWRLRTAIAARKDGTFVLEGMPPGQATVSAWSPNYAGGSAEVVVGRSTRQAAIGLTHGSTVAGRLVGKDRGPLAGRVYLLTPDGNGSLSSPTEEDGSFSFENLHAGSFTLRGESGGMNAQQEIELGADELREGIVLVLQGRQSVRGRVTGLSAEALADVHVTASAVGDQSRLLWDDGAKVDEHGAYVLHGVEPGRVELTTRHRSGVGRYMVKTVEVPTTGDVTVNFEFPSGVRLSGRLTRDGKPLGAAWIGPEPMQEQSLQGFGVQTTAQGDYVIEDLPRGDYRVVSENYRSEIIRITGDRVFDIDLAGGNLSGRLLLEDGDIPIAGVFVSVRPVERRASRLRLQAGSNQFGEFTITGLAEGDYLVSAYKPGYSMYRERLSYSTSTDRIEIRLQQTAGVKIAVHDAVTGKPLPAAYMIEVLDGDERGYWPIALNQDAIGRIPAGLAGATLQFGAAGYAPTVIRNWNGEEIQVLLTRQAAP